MFGIIRAKLFNLGYFIRIFKIQNKLVPYDKGSLPHSSGALKNNTSSNQASLVERNKFVMN